MLMRLGFLSFFFVFQLFQSTILYAKACNNRSAIGVARTLEIDTSTGPRYGRVQFKDQLLPLKHKEVVITFDDGPLPRITNSILRTLARHCTKATFFSVGKMAKAYPKTIQKVAAHGHTVGSHTHSHPRDLRHHHFPYSRFQIERGFQDVQAAVGKPIAPFFRFPGLHDFKNMNDYLGQRHIANFSVDIVPGDTNGYSAKTIIRNTLSQLRRQGKGILLLHDIKPATAAALPGLLSALKANGYKIVHMVPKENFKPISITFMNRLYEGYNHKNPKTIIGGLTYKQLYSAQDARNRRKARKSSNRRKKKRSRYAKLKRSYKMRRLGKSVRKRKKVHYRRTKW